MTRTRRSYTDFGKGRVHGCAPIKKRVGAGLVTSGALLVTPTFPATAKARIVAIDQAARS